MEVARSGCGGCSGRTGCRSGVAVIVKYHWGVTQPFEDERGSVEVEEDATDEEIESAIQEDIDYFVNANVSGCCDFWERPKPQPPAKEEL